jgi:quinol-cytochrome oxidoreductase complex cytochrome b subunit
MLLLRYGVSAAVLAAIVNAVLWAQVVILTVVPLLAGTVFYALLRRWTRRPFLIFFIVALVVFAVLLVPPFAATERPGTRFLLILMHVVATLAILAGLYQFERRRVRL